MARVVPSLFPAGDGAYLRMHLYVLGTHDGLVKVGMSSRPRGRINTHRRALRGGLAWVHLFPSAAYGTSNVAERDCIKHLARRGEQIGRTEWFRGVSKADAIEIARKALTSARDGHHWRDLEAPQHWAPKPGRVVPMVWRASLALRAAPTHPEPDHAE